MIIQKEIIFYIIVLLFVIKGICFEKCSQNLNRYIKNNLKPHQVVLLRTPNYDQEQVIAEVLQNYPYTSVDISKMSPKQIIDSTNRPSISDPKENILLDPKFLQQSYIKHFIIP